MTTAAPPLGDDPAQLLTREEAAQLMRLTPQTLTIWASRGAGPPRVTLGRKFVRYRLGDLREWLAEHTVPGGPPP